MFFLVPWWIPGHVSSKLLEHQLPNWAWAWLLWAGQVRKIWDQFFWKFETGWIDRWYDDFIAWKHEIMIFDSFFWLWGGRGRRECVVTVVSSLWLRFEDCLLRWISSVEGVPSDLVMMTNRWTQLIEPGFVTFGKKLRCSSWHYWYLLGSCLYLCNYI